MKKYLLALDEGTTSCRAVLFDSTDNMKMVKSVSEPLYAEYKNDGWVEQNANDIFLKQMLCVERLLVGSGYSADEVIAAGITNQRESVVLWDKETGFPVAPCINWQCRRTADFCEKLKREGKANFIKQKTGLVIDAYFSASKIKWLLDNVDGARERAANGELLCGTIESYLLYRFTGGKMHVTDVTNASRTMLFNINDMAWDDELLELFDVPKNILPTVVDNVGDFGTINVKGVEIPVKGIVGDQQSSLIGQACLEKGEVKCTYGTGAFILANIGETPIISDQPLITTVAYKIGEKKAYAFEGSVFNAGSVLNWLKNIGLIPSAADSEKIASECEDSGGVYLIPAFTGMGAPYWNMECRGAFFGLTRGTTASQLVRAGIESVALRLGEVFKLMEKTLNEKLDCLNVDGGMSKNNLLLKIQANVIGGSIRRSTQTESTALGAAYLAGLGANVIESGAEIEKNHRFESVFLPDLKKDKTEKLIKGYFEYVNKLLGE